MKLLILSLLATALAVAQSSPTPSPSRLKEWLGTSKLYWGGISALALGSAFDAGTSLHLNKVASVGGLHEVNPLLSNSNGQFDPARGVGAKLIVLGSTVAGGRLVVYFIKRKSGEDAARKVEKAFSFVNLGFAATYVGAAGHNLSLK